MDDFTLSVSVSRETPLNQLSATTWTVGPDLRLTSWDGGGLVPPDVAPNIRPGKSIADILRTHNVDSAALAAHARTLGGAATELSVRAAGREFQVSLSPLRGSGNHVIGVVGKAVEVTAEARDYERTRREADFGRALSTFLGHAMRHKVDDTFYQQTLEAALAMVPGAQAGSFWLRNHDATYQAVAALGFELAALEDVTLTAEELSHAEPGHAARLADAARRGGVNPEEPGRRRAPAPADVVRATLSVPVTLGDEAVAYLCLHSFEIGDAFDDQAREFVQLFANELAALFGHVQLQVALGEGRARLERFVGEYRALADFSAEIETIHDPEELIEYGMEHLLHTFRFDTAMFTELRGQALHFTRVRGAASEELSQALVEPQPLGAGINGRVAASGEPLYVEDYASWPSRHEPYVATGVLSMLALPIRRQGQVLHTLAFATIKRHAALDYYALRIARGFVKRLENAFERAYHLQEIKATREATFRSLGVALEYRDLETRGHTDRVVNLARCFADAVGLDPEQRQALAWGAYLHDLGKLAVPDAILLKPAKLTAEEFAVIRRHTLCGVEMVRDIAFLPAETVAVVRSHHERWDGGGYPDGLAGEDIPLLARMFSLVDVYDALTSERPYKRAWTHADAVTELQKQAGSQFDPHLVPLFLAALTEAAA